MGGTSLSALKLALALDRAVSLKDLIGHPILADQAELFDRRLKREVPAPAPVGAGRRAVTDTTTARGSEGRRFR